MKGSRSPMSRARASASVVAHADAGPRSSRPIPAATARSRVTRLDRGRDDVTARVTGAVGLAAVELLVHARDRVLAVIGDVASRLVQLRPTAGTIPEEAIALVRTTLALHDEHEGVGREARRVRGAGRAMHDLAFANGEDLLLAIPRPVVQGHVALDHVHDLVTGVDMELAAT